LTQRPPEVSAMLKAIISDATAGLGRDREAVSDVGGDGKKRNRAAIRGDIFKKRARPRAGCERSARRGSIPRARNPVDEYRVHLERWGGGLRRDTPALTYAERPVQGSHGEKRGVVPPGDGLHVDLNHLSRPFALPRLFSRNISEATSQRRPRALRRATRGQQWLSPLRERLHFGRAATRFES